MSVALKEIIPWTVPVERLVCVRMPFEIGSERYKMLSCTDGKLRLFDRSAELGAKCRTFENVDDARAWWKKWGARKELEPMGPRPL